MTRREIEQLAVRAIEGGACDDLLVPVTYGYDKAFIARLTAIIGVPFDAALLDEEPLLRAFEARFAAVHAS